MNPRAPSLLTPLLRVCVACARRYVVCVGGVEVFDSPAKDERLAWRAARLRHGARVLVVAQERDWLKVRYAIGNMSTGLLLMCRHAVLTRNAACK